MFEQSLFCWIWFYSLLLKMYKITLLIPFFFTANKPIKINLQYEENVLLQN